MSINRTALAAWAFSQPWMLHRPLAESMRQIVLRHASGVKLADEEIASIVAERDAKRATRRAAGGRLRGMSLDPDDHELLYMDGAGDAVAVVPVEGLLCSKASMVNDLSCPVGRTPSDVRYALQQAVSRRPKAIVLDIDSGGGTVAGMHDMIEAVEMVKAVGGGRVEDQIPLVAFIRNQGCSGAYLLASQCDAVYCTEQAEVGSIGVCWAVADSSKAYQDAGVNVTLIASGPFKGAGLFDGAAVTEAQISQEQASVLEMADWFVDRVAYGRRMDRGQVEALATGAVWVGERAVAAGLCNAVMGYDQLIANLSR